MEIVIIKNNDFAKDGKGVLFLSSNDYDLYAESFPAADFIAANSEKPDVMSAEQFVKHHFKDIDKKTEWFPALVAVADGYAKYKIDANSSKPELPTDNIARCPFCGNKPFEGHTKQGQHTIKCYDCAVEMTHDRQDKVRGHWNQRLQTTNNEPPTDYVPLFNHLANEHDLTLLDSELREIALKVPVPENLLLEKIELLKNLIRIGLIEKMPKDRQDALVELIGQIEAEAKKVLER